MDTLTGRQGLAMPDWGLDEVPWSSMAPDRLQDNEALFYLVTAASFIESGSDLYTGNLVGYFVGDDEVTAWLGQRWQVEEMRHGRVLRDYVQQAWPTFDWERAFAAFLDDYGRQCTVDAFEPTRALELAARCVVETGTATYYQALAAQAVEPVLAGIVTRIRADEISHYKHFYRYFREYCAFESPGRRRVLAVLGRRVLEARRGDGECALWHAFVERQAGTAPDRAAFQALNRRLGRQLRHHLPVEMAVKMLLRPLDLPPRFARVLERPISRAVGWALR
ncbi:ferritin-like domain-containing protein [Neisseriaceae bacterium JH1-16]|nr:ferritin-like domain-containing protein [Neisseriaceae bacterium JH1-16]